MTWAGMACEGGGGQLQTWREAGEGEQLRQQRLVWWGRCLSVRCVHRIWGAGAGFGAGGLLLC
jgi:hypothetical protein